MLVMPFFFYYSILATCPASHGCNADTKLFFDFILHVTYIPINLPLESLYLKKTYPYPLGSFNDLSIHRDGQRATLLWFHPNSCLR
jgi:hypothetical protein